MQLSSALQGAVSGMMVTRNNGAPGASSSIKIRGITTIGDSNPLVIVDGVPIDGIDMVNPNDVENISVLKDAAVCINLRITSSCWSYTDYYEKG